MDKSTLTLGDVLPSGLKSKFADVLDVKLEEAIQIAKYAMPPSSVLTKNQIAEINKIYKAYLANKDTSTGSAYWNRTVTDNSAYWSKT